jgi:RNA-directed DNA polymerase
VLQRAVVMLLEPIYEREFCDFSYGFRPGRSAHQALNALWKGITENRARWIVDVDIRKFFDTLDHGKLREILDKRIKDGVIRRLIDKWLAAGVMEAGEWSCPETGTPQGGVVSPLLSNIFLNEVLDDWFVQAVKPRLKGRGFMIRYADDFVMGFENREDAERVMAVLPKRLARYGLSANLEKSKLEAFAPPGLREPGGKPVGSFDFLGFTHYWGRNLRGRWVVKRKTSRKRLARALKAVRQWCRDNRHQPLAQQHRVLAQKLTGHFAYYGMTGNGRSLHRFREGVRRLWHKWLNRRTRKRDTLSWERFAQLCAQHYRLPKARIIHSVFRAKPSTGGTGCV